MIPNTIKKIEQAYSSGDSISYNCNMQDLKMQVRAYCRGKGYYTEAKK